MRCIGEITREKLAILRDADFIFREEIEKAGLGTKVWQYFAIINDSLSTGVDATGGRTYEHMIALRAAINTHDAVTADWVELPYSVLRAASSRIVKEVKGVNRVVYDITAKPPATIEWE